MPYALVSIFSSAVIVVCIYFTNGDGQEMNFLYHTLSFPHYRSSWGSVKKNLTIVATYLTDNNRIIVTYSLPDARTGNPPRTMDTPRTEPRLCTLADNKIIF